jgi:hypothetical protein
MATETEAAMLLQAPLTAEERREHHVQDIMTACHLLNEKGDRVEMPGNVFLPWNAKSLHAFITGEFDGADGIDSLSTANLLKLKAMLSLRLDEYNDVAPVEV